MQRNPRARHADQPKLFDLGQTLPNGLVYRPDFITPAEEEVIVAYIQNLPLEHATHTVHTATPEGDIEVEAKRRHRGFGWGWDYRKGVLVPPENIKEPLPRFLQGLQRKIAKYLQIEPARVGEALINEYTPGSAIGWHVDNEGFEKIIGVSLAGWCRMRFRPLPWERGHRLGKRSPALHTNLRSREVSRARSVELSRHRLREVSRADSLISLELEPRSAYIMQHDVRWKWQHSVAPVSLLRYSITFRTLPPAVSVAR